MAKARREVEAELHSIVQPDQTAGRRSHDLSQHERFAHSRAKTRAARFVPSTPNRFGSRPPHAQTLSIIVPQQFDLRVWIHPVLAMISPACHIKKPFTLKLSNKLSTHEKAASKGGDGTNSLPTGAVFVVQHTLNSPIRFRADRESKVPE